MNKKLNLLYIVFLIFFLQKINSQNNNLIAISIPKTGTGLLDKLIRLMTKKHHALDRLLNEDHILKYLMMTNLRPKVDASAIQLFTPSLEILDKCTRLHDGEYLRAHLAYYYEYDKLLNNKNFKKIFIIRDPRDQIISRIYYFYRHKNLFSSLQNLSINEFITALIGSSDKIFFEDLLSSHTYYDYKPSLPYISNILSFYNEFIPWRNTENCYTVKFENLVGPKGGSNLQIQINEIKKISAFLGLNLNDMQIKKIADELFGGTSTFREGKIGAWKKYFTNEHKEAFKKVAGQLLIDLGYEKDLNW